LSDKEKHRELLWRRGFSFVARKDDAQIEKDYFYSLLAEGRGMKPRSPRIVQAVSDFYKAPEQIVLTSFAEGIANEVEFLRSGKVVRHRFELSEDREPLLDDAFAINGSVHPDFLAAIAEQGSLSTRAIRRITDLTGKTGFK